MDSDIVKLAGLLNPKRVSESDSGDETENDTNNTGPSPGDIGESKPSVYAKQKAEYSVSNVTDTENEALYLNECSESASDWRKTPQWDVSYKQQVTSSDVFLQMSAKSPATTSCEDMILKICLPEEDHHNIDLKVTKNHIKLLSPKFQLEIPLPHPVNPQCGNAQWNKDMEQLIVTLRMDREFDFINF